MDIGKSLARLLGRASNPAATRLRSHALGRPLLIHPGIAAELTAGFFRGAGLGGGDDYDGDENSGPGSASVQGARGVICVLNISGPLSSRPEPGISGTPVSYESIRCAFDAALADGNVSAIVFRMDSPGGAAAQCFDLCDYIFSKRGAKPIIAQVDDIAYSGAYAIASACDSIQVSRTSGIGSIGVVYGHVDQSGADKQAGLVFTYIFSGDHKVDGNPHEPLPESVKNALQADSDSIRDLFVASVAKYRGLDAEAVLATQANCYMGDKAIAAGLADTVGTLPELLAQLASPAKPDAPESQTTAEEDEMKPEVTAPGAADETPEQKAARESAAANVAAVASTNDHNARVVALQTAVHSSELSDTVQTAVLKKGPQSGITAAAQVAQAAQIEDLCVAAKLDAGDAKEFIEKGASVTQVRRELADLVAPRTAKEIKTSLGRAAASGGEGNLFAKATKKMADERSGPGFKSAKPTY